MSKQKYRSKFAIVNDVLTVIKEAGQEGIIISAICRRANLSHYTGIENCNKLRNAGLIYTVRNDRNDTYRITTKGLQFLQEYQKFLDVVESVNLRC